MGLFDLFKKGNKGDETKQEFEGKVVAPISGNILPLSEVPDEVFAQKMVGDGIAIEPTASGVMLARLFLPNIYLVQYHPFHLPYTASKRLKKKVCTPFYP